MACFLVPLTEAVVTTVAQKVLEKKEKKNLAVENQSGVSADSKVDSKSDSALTHTDLVNTKKKFSFAKALKPLNIMLWGGSALLAFEHVWHGEVVPWFPFLTAAANPEDAAVMLHEMATIGVTMAVAVTAVWAIALTIKHFVGKKKTAKDTAKETV